MLSLFGDISAEIWIKQKLHNFYDHVMKLKALPKNFTKLTFVSNFAVDGLFPVVMNRSNI